jgi:hypothetical protein
MTTTFTRTFAVKPWYASRTLWGGAVLALVPLLSRVGIEVSDAERQLLVDSLVGLAEIVGTVVGLVLVIWGRARASTAIKLPGLPPTPPALVVALLCLAAIGLLGGCADGNLTKHTRDAVTLRGGPAGKYAFRFDGETWSGDGAVGQGMAEGGGRDQDGNPEALSVTMPAPFASLTVDLTTGVVQFASGKDGEIEGFQAKFDPQSKQTDLTIARVNVSASRVLDSLAAIVEARAEELIAMGEQQREIELEKLRAQVQVGGVVGEFAGSVLATVAKKLTGVP